MAPRYYAQLPIYHIEDGEQRRFLAAAYRDGPAPGFDERLARRFGVPVGRCRAILRRANAAYRSVVDEKFLPRELRRSTDGYLP